VMTSLIISSLFLTIGTSIASGGDLSLRPAQLEEEAGLAQGEHALARQHRTAAARVSRWSVPLTLVPLSGVLFKLTSLSWLPVSFLHTVRFVPTGGPCGRTGVYHSHGLVRSRASRHPASRTAMRIAPGI
jgi:hypothetical protein